MKWHIGPGGKHYLAARIASLLPPHRHYVEPYAGSLAVLFAKDPEGASEVVNDLDGNLINFWGVLRDPTLFAILRRMCEATPFAEQLWEDAGRELTPPQPFQVGRDVPRAWAFFVRCRMSLAGRLRSFTGVTKTRTRRGMNAEASAWLSAIDALPDVHARLRRVLILNRDAVDVIRGQDGPDSVFYLDPPYVHGSRASPDVYGHEMSDAQHAGLLEALAGVKGKFVLSGYPSPLYLGHAASNGWRRVDVEMANHAAGGASKRRVCESLWMNFDPPGVETCAPDVDTSIHPL